jgi:hypothetical protein
MGWDVVKARGNGCGPQGWKVDLVPDSVYGCYIGEACYIHDLQYDEGQTIKDKNEADRTLRNNIIRLIRARTTTWAAKRFLLKFRLAAAQVYYEAVQHFAGPAFWDKNKKA